MKDPSPEIDQCLDRADALRNGGDPRAAVAELEECNRRHPDNPELQLNLGISLIDSDPARAKKLLDRAAVLSPNDPDLLTVSGTMMLYLDDRRRAKELCEQAIALAPRGMQLQVELIHLAARIALLGGQYAEAEKGLVYAFEHAPEGVAHGQVLAEYLSDRGRFEEAWDVVQRSLEFFPRDEKLLLLQQSLRLERA